MRLVTRLWIFGALFPALGAAAAFFLAGESFRHSLHQALDEALLAQATTEAISLFDDPHRPVHLHMEISPLLEQARPFAPVASVYGPDGRLEVVFPKVSGVPARLLPSTEIERPVLRTDREVNARELTVTLMHPKEKRPYTLRLASGLGGIDATMRRFHVAATLLTVIFAVGLGAIQAVRARTLARRISNLASHVAGLARGELDRLPSEDSAGDEISGLRDAIAHATLELEGSRKARDRLLADAAHELRTPLAAMRISLDLALRRKRSSEELEESLRETRDEVDRLAALSNRLLDLAAVRSAPLAADPVDLRDVAGASASSFAALAQERGVRLAVDGGPAPVAGDAPALRQAIDNLVHNALSLTPEGCTVRIHTEHAVGRSRLVVDDEGPGIPADEREAVFEPFRRATQKREGAGLGLPMVREIAGRHRGQAGFEDPPAGRGARVVLDLPSLGS
ncbi:MAG TPA: HAMP domain-containing sensor histidine kinase [Vulgatibacter sp.]